MRKDLSSLHYRQCEGQNIDRARRLINLIYDVLNAAKIEILTCKKRKILKNVVVSLIIKCL